mmetsp:Transcript_39408/g.106386  ORF Transcript_39408/g.106386 Transcript_39408/m.106386 type:complete len:168 (-) Transcript_39408:67-570(-)
MLQPPLHLHRNERDCDFTTYARAPTATATFGCHRKHRHQRDRCRRCRRLGSLHYCTETQVSGLALGRGISKGESGGVSGSETDQQDSQADDQQPDGAAVEVDDDMEDDAEVDFCCGGKREDSNFYLEKRRRQGRQGRRLSAIPDELVVSGRIRKTILGIPIPFTGRG